MALCFPATTFSQGGSIGARALFNEGLDYYEQGLRRLAADSFRKCLDVDPTHKEAKKYLAMIGHSFISDEIQDALERDEVYKDMYGTLDRASYQGRYPPVSRNLDYRSADSPPVAKPPG